MLSIFKKLLDIVRNKIKKNPDNWLKNKKVIQSQKMSTKKCPKNSKFLVSKYIKVLEFLKNPKTFLNKGTKHKKNYMEGLNF